MKAPTAAFSPTTILVPCPNVAPGSFNRLHVRRVPVVLECLRAVASVHGAVADVQRDQLRLHVQRPDPTRPSRSLRSRFLYCPSDPGSHIDDASLGGTGDATTSYGTCDGDWYVWSVNWARALFGRARESLDVRAQLLRDGSPMVTDGTEQHADGVGGLHRSRPDAKLRELAGGRLRTRHRDLFASRISRPRARLRPRRWPTQIA